MDKIKFKNMTKKEALKYCYKNEKAFVSKLINVGDDGQRQFDCLIEILENETIKASDLPDYGMDYD